ncbi:MAG: WD40 repeat domain-containing protein [Planctomycetes bacterium]|nr:WD40 repeat domain-containing protein [Planctomycetota bacterium]
MQLFGDEERAIVLVREGAFLVDLRSGRVLVHRTLPLSRWQTRYTSTPASVLPIWGWHAGLRVLDVETLDVLWELEACELATYDPASDVVVVIQDLGGPVTVHDAGSGERLWGLEGRALDIAPAGLRRRAIVFDGAGKFLASSYDNSVRYSFDCRTGACEELPMVLHGTAAHAGPLTDDALWVADRGGELRSLSADDGSEQASVVLGEPLASVESIDGVLVAASQSGRTRVWRGPELEAVTEFDGGPEFALASGADRVISCGGDREGWVAWSIHTGGLLATGGEDLGTFVDVACDVDGRVVIALDEARNAHVWVDGEITPLEGLLSPVEELVVDPRGRWVALGALGRDGERMAPFLTVYDLVQTGPPRQLGVEGSFVWSGGHIRSLAVDHGAEFLVATTGKWGTVQCWNTSDWSHQWIYDFGGGSPSPLQLNLDEANGRAWVWGLSRDAPRALDLGTGKSVVDFGETLMGDFSPLGKQRGVTAIVNGCLVRLDHEGSEQWRRIDLGPLGAVISSAAGSVRGDAAALEHVFVRVGDRVVRASEVAEGE